MRGLRQTFEPGRDEPAALAWTAFLGLLAAAAFGVDVWWLGLPLLGLALLGPLGGLLLMIGVIRWLLHRRRSARRALLRAAWVWLCGLGAFFVCQAGDARGREGAREIAAALALHRERSGAYPDSLEALVPEPLSAVPPVGFRAGDDGFGYRLGQDGRPSLCWRTDALDGCACWDFGLQRIERRRR